MSKMNKTLKNCILAVLCFFAASVVGFFLIINFDGKEKDDVNATDSVSYLYTLTEYNGKIALYKNGFSMPIEIFDVNINSLPQSDRELIKNGIHASNDSEIQRFIEDYTS